MQRLFRSKTFFTLIFRRTKTDESSIVPKAAQNIKEAAKEHIRELRREFDRPVQFSTSRAKTWDTADSLVYNRQVGKFMRPVLMVTAVINIVRRQISFSLLLDLIDFVFF